MSTTIHLAIDYFFHNWKEGKQGDVWISIQPYVLKSELTRWIKQSIHDGHDTTYNILSLNNTIDGELYSPISLPSEHDFSILFKDANNAGVVSIQSDRLNNITVKDEKLFKQQNGFDSSNGSATFAINEPYVKMFNASLKAMADSNDPRTNSDTMTQWLIQKFEMGQRIKFNNKSISAANAHFDASNKYDKGLKATNQHFMLGQLVKLTASADDLSTITDLEFSIDQTPLLIEDEMREAVKNIFSTIPELEPKPGPHSTHWNTDFSRRVNAIARGDDFRARPIKVGLEDGAYTPMLWRLKRDNNAGDNTTQVVSAKQHSKSAPPLQISWNKLERLTMRLSAPLLKDANGEVLEEQPELDYSPFPTDVTFVPAVTFEVQLSLYRKTPNKLSDGTVHKSTLLKVAPTPEELSRFNNFISNNGHWDLLQINNELPLNDSVFLYKNPHAEHMDDDDKKVVPAAIKLNWLERFQFPWNVDPKTGNYPYKVLAGVDLDDAFYHDAHDGDENIIEELLGNATLVIKLAPQVPLSTALIDHDPSQPSGIRQGSVFGPRWEQWRDQIKPEALPPFNALYCDDLSALPHDVEGVDLDSLVVSTYQKHNVDFELAQSARRLEGVFTASYRGIDDGDRADISTFTASQTYLEDKVNHNRVNLFQHHSKEHTEKKNKDSCISPVFYKDNKKQSPRNYFVDYVFHIKMTDRTSAPATKDDVISRQVSDQFETSPRNSREFYKEVYSRIGAGRTLSLSIEHTYGSAMDEVWVENVPTPLDEPILLASDIEHKPTNTSGIARSGIPFLEVKYVAPDEENPTTSISDSKLILTMRTEYLTDHFAATNKQKLQTHIMCWQSVAEAAHAEKGYINIEYYDFKVQEALANNSLSIPDGLKEETSKIALSDIYTLNDDNKAPKNLHNILSNLLEHGCLEKPVDPKNPPPLPNTIDFVLSGDARLGLKYYALRCEFEVLRKEKYAPLRGDNKYDIHAKLERIPNNNVENLYSKDGCVTKLINDTEVKNQLNNHFEKLRHRAGYLTPNITDTGRAKTKVEKRFRNIAAMLGPGRKSEAGTPSANAWLVLNNTVKKSGELDIAYCPIGIKPIAMIPMLGELTSQYVRKYFSGMQHLIDCSTLSWFSNDASTLRTQIKNLSIGSKFSSKYELLIDKALDKFLALPDPSLDDTLLNPTIKEISKKVNKSLKSPETQNDPDNLGLRQHLKRMLLREPALFDKLKSIGLVQIKGLDGSKSQLPEDFHNLVISRQIDDKQTPLLNSLDLPFGFKVDNNTIWHLELLDDATYDNEFTFKQIIGESVERAIEQVPIGKFDPLYTIPLLKNKISIPAPTPKNVAGASISLASRRTVVDPKHSSTTHLLGDTIVDLDLSKPLDLASFVNTKLLHGDATGSPVFVAKTKHNFDSFNDTAHVAAVFTVSGDEESTSDDPLEGISNDAFYVIVEEAEDKQTIQTDSAFSEGFIEALKILKSKNPLATQELEKLAEPTAITKCTSILKNELPARQPPTENVKKAFKLSPKDNVEQNSLQKVSLVPHGTSAQLDNVGVWLFRGKNVKTIYLWIQVAMPIWRSCNIKLVQTRNELSVDKEKFGYFSPEFATISKPVESSVSLSPLTLENSNVFNSIPISNTYLTPREFVNTVLPDALTDAGPNFEGKKHTLTITIKESASTQFPSAGGSIYNINAGSFSPYIITVKPKKDNEESEPWNDSKFEFIPDTSIKRWRIDFEWRDTKLNKEILRIEDVPIEIL